MPAILLPVSSKKVSDVSKFITYTHNLAKIGCPRSTDVVQKEVKMPGTKRTQIF